MDNRTRQVILIVDDQIINREILENILQDDYRILNAENGKKALDLLAGYGEEISAVLLDLIMPVMDGYQFLDAIQDTEYSNLPIIVMTGENSGDTEEKALEKGAWDYINKPYQPAVLRGRLRNAIARSKLGMLDRLQYVADHDPLTGLYNRNKFMKETRAMIDSHPELKFAVIRVDIDRFSLLNSFWGEKGGDEFLKYLAVLIQDERSREPIAVFGRINADVFCICEQYEEAGFRQLVETVRINVQKYNTSYFVKPTFGVCLVDDRSLPIEVLYERAAMAARTCKGKYNENIGFYNITMHETTMRDQRIVNEMQRALELKQFQVYLQPKYSLKTNKPYGAEALVRWKHPEKGMVSPGDFIPVFERNGFIGKLDYFMWDAVSALLKKWIDEGLDPAPISVNISRVNMYNPQIVEILCELVKKHEISPALLNLELTESAYMDNPDIMKEIVKDLQDHGFVVMMDDFGSGYSSLNTLREIPVDVLKIDMKFLENKTGDGRSERILASTIRMAGWLNLPVIVEGVETKKQMDFLRSVGCGFVQGFFFARPMPVSEYEEKVLRTEPAFFHPNLREDADAVNTAIWTNDSNLSFIVDKIHRPVAVFEYDGEKCFPLRVNGAYNQLFGYGSNASSSDKKNGFAMERAEEEKVRALFREAADSKITEETEYQVTDASGKVSRLRLTLDRLGEVENVQIMLAVFKELMQPEEIPVKEKQEKPKKTKKAGSPKA